MTGGVSAGTIIAGIGAAASALGAIQSLTAKKPSAGAAPQVQKATVMPTPDDEAAKAAQRRSLAGQAVRKGRQSTILENDATGGDLLGG